MGKKKKDELNPKEQLTVALYTDRENKRTFLNKTQSYAEAYNVVPEAANHIAYKLFQRDRVRNAVQEVLEAKGFGMDSRLGIISAIGDGSAVRKRQVVTKTGNVIEIDDTPSFSEQIKAVELANKMDGTYVEQQLAKDIAKEEHKRLQNEILKDVTKAVDPVEDAEIVEDEDSGEE